MKEKLAIFVLLLLSFTGISVATLGKALVTPFHVVMGALIAFGIFFGRKSTFYTFMSLNALGLWILFVNANYFPNIRYTSILYSLIYIIELTIFYNLIRQCKPETIYEGFKILIYLYFVNICIGVVLIALNINIPVIETVIGIARTTAGTRAMGFSSEPSYAAFVLSVSFLAYNHIYGHRLGKSTLKLWIVYTLSIGLMMSAYGFIFLFMNLLDWLRHYYGRLSSSLRLGFIGVSILMLFSIIQISAHSQNEAIERLDRLTTILGDPNNTTEKKLYKLKEEDPSAFARIGPTYILFWGQNDIETNFYLGAGAGAAGNEIPKLMAGVLIDEGDDEFDTGIIPAFIFDYGYIGVLVLLLFLFNAFYNLPFPFWLMFFLILPNANINTQLFWFGIASFMTVSMVKSTYKIEREDFEPEMVLAS